ncbi:MAG: NYN domain-containing protein [Deltaproteobacteria bacterium]
MTDPTSSWLEDAPNMAIFCDFENVAIGAQKASYDELDIRLVLERLLDKGKIVVKKAYADWDRYKQHKRQMHEASFELIEIPHVSYSGKNSADIRLVVDALDLCYVKKHVDIFVIVSGDSDFSPLVSKLRENNKRVIGLGVKSSTSDLLIDNCDEFIYYDDLVRERREAQRKEAASRRAKAEVHRTEPGRTEPGRTEPGKTEPGRTEPGRAEPGRVEPGRAEPGRVEPGRAEANKPETTKAEAAKTEARGPRPAGNGSATPASGSFALPAGAAGTDGKTVEERQKEAIELVLDVVEALFQDRDGALHGALVKQTLKRKRPEFSERFHGYRTFNQLLEDAGRRGLLDLSHDESSGGYVVLAFGPNA